MMAQYSMANHHISIRSACRRFRISETCYIKLIGDLLMQLSANEDTAGWSFGMCFKHFRNLKGYKWNHKRVYRIYCVLALNLRIKPKRRLNRHTP